MSLVFIDSYPVGEMMKAGAAEDGGPQGVESDAPAVKTVERREDAPPEHNLGDRVEGMESGKTKKGRSDVDGVPAELKTRGILMFNFSWKRVENVLSDSFCDRVEGMESGKTKKGRSEVDGVPADLKTRVSLPVADAKKYGLCEDEDVQVAKSDVPSQKLQRPAVKSEEKKEDVPSQKVEGPSVKRKEMKEVVLPKNNVTDQTERMDNEISRGNDLDLRLLRKTTGISLKADVSTTTQERKDDNVRESSEGKGENHLQGDTNSSTQAKMVSSGLCQKNEKMNQPIPQQPSKLFSHAVSMHPPASASAATTLSDEELALLLHQELNSSPRVPRIPRMRLASGMQLTSQIASSMLSKRSSYSGGKDQVFRRNKEETSKDGSRNSQDSIDEKERTGRALPSPDWKCRESSCMTDSFSKKDSWNRSPDATVSMRKNMLLRLR